MDIKNIDFELDIDPGDVDRTDYSGYTITSINVAPNEKKILSVSYKYIWDCGDGCCSETHEDICYSNLSQWLKERILKEFPEYSDYTFGY